ncbi:MAG TPA: spore cortex biosynthesis protein YabQ [Negativicutes bacterium]|nr:spore cortex biosynthesis protein YabQ [Negativicutes bacterium]
MNADGQVETFVITVATGVFLGLAFDFYRVLRALYRPRWLLTALADLVYWLFATGVVFLALLYGNWGELRLYAFIGLALGALGYYRLLSRTAVHLLTGLLRLVAGAVRAVRTAVAYAVFKPLRYIAGLIAWPVRRLGEMLAARRPPPDDTVPPP